MASERDGAKKSAIDPVESDPELEAKIADGKAKAASIALASGMESHLHKVSVCGVYVIGGLVVVAIAIWLFHFMVPTSYRFLTPEQVESLQKILFSGFIGGAIGGQAKKISK
jgi:hypothetical protein